MAAVINIFDKYRMVVPEGLKWHSSDNPGPRSVFITDQAESFTITFEEGMQMMDMLPKENAVPVVNHQCFENGKYIHLRRGSTGSICIYEDHTGDIYFDDYYHDFTWVMEGDRFIANANDEPSIVIDGTLKDGIMELVYEENVYLCFQQQTQQELDQLAVDHLRDCMEDTVQKMAVAYLGWYEGDEDFSVWLSKSCPKLLEEYPFIASVPEEQIIGRFGEVYCLIPKDEQANVTIGLLKDDGSEEIAKVLHQSNTGEPLLLICNYRAL